MPTETLLALAGFAFVTSITPGPNNLMLLASGVNYGFVRTMPHMAGIAIGFVVMLIGVGAGLGQLLTANATIYLALKIAGILYMLWLAWKIANAGPVEGGTEGRERPMTFLEAAAFQWVNPKAWAMALTAVATYTQPANYLPSLLMVGGVFGIINWPSVGVWAGFGVALRQMLQDPVKVRVFNVAMALLLVASLAPAVMELVRG